MFVYHHLGDHDNDLRITFHWSIFVTVCTQGVLSLKNSHFEPRYILTTPLTTKVPPRLATGLVTSKSWARFGTHSLQVHEERLKASDYTASQIKEVLQEVQLYWQMHQDNPGFFDAAINTGSTICLCIDIGRTIGEREKDSKEKRELAHCHQISSIVLY